jgi:hypothetical protein
MYEYNVGREKARMWVSSCDVANTNTTQYQSPLKMRMRLRFGIWSYYVVCGVMAFRFLAYQL